VFGLTLFLVTLLFSAFFSCSETAYVSSNRLKMHLKSRGKKVGPRGSAIMENAQKVLTITMVGNTAANIAASSLAVFILTPHLPEAVILVITTLILLILGDIIPKAVAQQIPNRLIRILPPFLNLAYLLLYPLIQMTGTVSQFLVSFLGGAQDEVKTFFKKRDLPVLIRLHASMGHISPLNELLINRALKISDKRINEAMIPRTDIFALDVETPLTEIIDAFVQTRHSRIPIFENDMDHILGFLHAFDLFYGKKNVRELVRPALYFPESSMAVDVLEKLRKASGRAAIIIDEFGGTAGLVTLEDILEKLLGEIHDEFDTDEDMIYVQSDGSLFVSGRAEIDDLHDRYGFEFPEGDYVTIAGFIESQLGSIPKAGEILYLPAYRLEILKADATKIIQIKIVKKSVELAADPARNKK
jgi:putative hemolysin